MLAAVAATAVVAAPDQVAAEAAGLQPQQMFVLAGQSNMAGYGQPLTLAAPTSPRLLAWGAQGWQVASDPLPGPEEKTGVGPGMIFGLQVAKRQPGLTIGLVQCAVGGSPIADWQPGAPQSWYQACLARAKAALSAGGRLAGLLFLQGESDAYTPATASGWLSGFRSMKAAFRRDLPGRWPLLLGQIGALDPTKYRAQQQVRDAQAAAAAEDPTIRLVRTLDLPTDGTHFTVPAYRVIGARFATAWWRWRTAP